MDNPPIMRRDKSLCDLQRVVNRQPYGKRSFRQPLSQGFALEQFANNVRRAVAKTDVVDGDNVGMIQGRGSAGFELKTPQMIWIVTRGWPDYLQSNIASQPLVPRPKHIPHGSRANFFEDSIMTYDRVTHQTE